MCFSARGLFLSVLRRASLLLVCLFVCLAGGVVFVAISGPSCGQSSSTQHMASRHTTTVPPPISFPLYLPFHPRPPRRPKVLYTYLNVPFLELKRQSLLQQAQIASERLEKEYQELAGFIGGHSYGNYMQHLRTSDVDPTAGIILFHDTAALRLLRWAGLVFVHV